MKLPAPIFTAALAVSGMQALPIYRRETGFEPARRDALTPLLKRSEHASTLLVRSLNPEAILSLPKDPTLNYATWRYDDSLEKFNEVDELARQNFIDAGGRKVDYERSKPTHVREREWKKDKYWTRLNTMINTGKRWSLASLNRPMRTSADDLVTSELPTPKTLTPSTSSSPVASETEPLAGSPVRSVAQGPQADESIAAAETKGKRVSFNSEVQERVFYVDPKDKGKIKTNSHSQSRSYSHSKGQSQRKKASSKPQRSRRTGQAGSSARWDWTSPEFQSISSHASTSRESELMRKLEISDE